MKSQLPKNSIEKSEVANSNESTPAMLKELEDIQLNLMRNPMDFVWMQEKVLQDQYKTMLWNRKSIGLNDNTRIGLN